MACCGQDRPLPRCAVCNTRLSGNIKSITKWGKNLICNSCKAKYKKARELAEQEGVR